MFPNLKDLHLGRLKHGEDSPADIYAAMLYYHTPQVESWAFWVKSSDPFEEAVGKAHKQIREEPHRFLLQRAMSNMRRVIE